MPDFFSKLFLYVVFFEDSKNKKAQCISKCKVNN